MLPRSDFLKEDGARIPDVQGLDVYRTMQQAPDVADIVQLFPDGLNHTRSNTFIADFTSGLRVDHEASNLPRVGCTSFKNDKQNDKTIPAASETLDLERVESH